MGWEYPGKEPGIVVPTDIPDGNIEGSSQGCFSQHSMDIPDGLPAETNGFLKHRQREFQIPKSLKFHEIPRFWGHAWSRAAGMWIYSMINNTEFQQFLLQGRVRTRFNPGKVRTEIFPPFLFPTFPTFVPPGIPRAGIPHNSISSTPAFLLIPFFQLGIWTPESQRTLGASQKKGKFSGGQNEIQRHPRKMGKREEQQRGEKSLFKNQFWLLEGISHRFFHLFPPEWKFPEEKKKTRNENMRKF